MFTFAIMLTVGLVISHLVADRAAAGSGAGRLEVAAETERIRSALLARFRTTFARRSPSWRGHRLRWPSGRRLSPQERQALAKSIFEQSRDMAERVAKVLQMTRLETGAIRIDRDWTSIARDREFGARAH